MNRNRVCWIIGLVIWFAAVQTGWSFYSSKTGRWLSRDPLAEKSFTDDFAKGTTQHEKALLTQQARQNSYCFLHNSPINTVDFLGLSPADVATIVNTATEGFFELCDKCMRCDNGIKNQILWFNPFQNIKGCGQQADYVGTKLAGKKYDSIWNFEIVNNNGPFGIPSPTPWLPHQWGQSKSDDPNDAAIAFDPWKGKIVVLFPNGIIVLFEMTCKPRQVKRTVIKDSLSDLPPPKFHTTPPHIPQRSGN